MKECAYVRSFKAFFPTSHAHVCFWLFKVCKKQGGGGRGKKANQYFIKAAHFLTFQAFRQVFGNVAEACNSGSDVIGQLVSIVWFKVQGSQKGIDGIFELVHLLVGQPLQQVSLQEQDALTLSVTCQI